MTAQFVFEKVFQSVHVDTLPHTDPYYQMGKATEVSFTNMVDLMRDPARLPLPSVNKLMALFWNLVGNRITPTGITKVPTLSFWAEIRNDRSIAMILCPEWWHLSLAKEPYFQMGALVFAASQAKDYWNHKFLPGSREEVKARSLSYEAELLHYFAKDAPDFKPNDYQKDVMAAYPNGLASVSSHYEGRDYDPFGGPPFTIDTEGFNLIQNRLSVLLSMYGQQKQSPPDKQEKG